MLADMGLVGFPNAGKSSLLHNISNARPKVAHYAFTTLHPNIGTMHFQDQFKVSVADLPGILEDAHENRGLGLEFLRHIERCRVLCFVIDMSTESAFNEFMQLRKELSLYSDGSLSGKPAIIIANKMDIEGSEKVLTDFKEKLEAKRLAYFPIVPISAKTGKGTKDLPGTIRDLVINAAYESEREADNAINPRLRQMDILELEDEEI